MAHHPRAHTGRRDSDHGNANVAGAAFEHRQAGARADGCVALRDRPDDETPIAYNRVAGVVVTGNEDGAHHVISEVAGALVDIGYTVPGQAWTYWNKGPGPGDEEWLTTDHREWSITTARTAAQNLVAAARGLRASALPAPAQ
jgi:hypothetical protein